jgi:hypothetical protein
MFTDTHTQQNARFADTGGLGQTYPFTWDGKVARPARHGVPLCA